MTLTNEYEQRSQRNDIVNPVIQSHIALLIRLRIMEQLATISYPRVAIHTPQDLLLDILNWLSYCFDRSTVSQRVSLAFSTQPGLITLYVSHCSANRQQLRGLKTSVAVMMTLLREVLPDSPPEQAGKTFVKMVIQMCLPRILRKVLLVGLTDEDPQQTLYHFNSLVSLWLVHRPQGEQSKEFVNMAINFGGNASRATEYMLQALYTLVHQNEALRSTSSEDMQSYILSTITACGLMVTSTFFSDLTGLPAFKLALKTVDRIFLHKLLRRIARVAAYREGAMQFAYNGLPFIRRVLGVTGISDFLNNTGMGGIRVLLVPASPTTVLKWPSSPNEVLPDLFHLSTSDVPEDESLPASHSRNTSLASNSTGSSSSFGCHSLRSELSNLDSQLRYDLMNSDLLAQAWIPGDSIITRCHSEMQLIHFLEQHDILITCLAIGTSKPVCWTCSHYMRHCDLTKLLPTEPEPDVNDDPIGWWHSKPTHKVHHDWMVPPFAQTAAIEALLEDAQQEMERMVDEVAFDYFA